MNLASGQVFTLEQIKTGVQAQVVVKLADRDLHMGDLMDMWLFHPTNDPVRFECFIAGFTIMADSNPQALLAVQMGDSPYYVVVDADHGTVCQPGELTPEQAKMLSQQHFLLNALPPAPPASAPRGNMGYSHTRAPESDKPFTKALEPRRSHLKVVASNATPAGEPDGQAQADPNSKDPTQASVGPVAPPSE